MTVSPPSFAEPYCRAVRLVTPQHEQQRALQNEAVPIARLAESVQEPFQPILRQEQLKILAPFRASASNRSRTEAAVFFPRLSFMPRAIPDRVA